MTEVTFYENGIEVTGHSLFEKKGKDIVCSAISSITYGFINSIDEENKKYKIDYDNVKIVIKIKNITSKYKHYLELLWFQYETIRQSYPNNVKIIIKKGSINHE